MDEYSDFLTRNAKSNNIKNIEKSVDQLSKATIASFESALIKTLCKHYEINRLPPISLFHPDFKDVVFNKLKIIIGVQSLLSYLTGSIYSVLENLVQTVADSNIEIDKIKESADSISNRAKLNVDEIGKLVDGFDKAVKEIEKMSKQQ